MPVITKVKVVPNPFHSLAHDGTPQGVVGYPGSRGYIGAQIDHVHSGVHDASRFYFPRFPDHVYEVPLDGVIANAILEGSLIAATEECARKVGIAKDDYQPVDQALAAEKTKAEAELTARYGDAVKLQDVPTTRVPHADEGDGTATPAKPAAVTSRGDRVLSGTAAQPHVVLATTKE